MSYNFFVSIASYKDPELAFTINNVLENARRPDDIRIVVCQQDSPENFISLPYSNVEFLNFHFVESEGVCWARYQICQKYSDEPYFLQLDSHMALTKNWDDLILDQISLVKSKGSSKVVFAAYPTSYKIENGIRIFHPPDNPRTILRTDDIFTFHNGTQGYNNFAEPIPSPFLNGGFIFGDGSFLKDCIYDPDIYVNGEELLSTVKAFTHGYDLFNPGVHMSWHLYKPWDIPQSEKQKWPVHHREEDDKLRKVRHWERNKRAEEKLIKIFSGQMPEVLGTKRTLKDYEEYIGRPLLKEHHLARLKESEG